MNITRQQFWQYEGVRREGSHNMLTTGAFKLSGLTKPAYHYIIQHYDKLTKKYIKKELK